MQRCRAIPRPPVDIAALSLDETQMTQPNRQLMALALNGRLSPADIATSAEEIDATITAARGALAKSALSLPAGQDRDASIEAICDALRPLGAKVMPTVSEEKGQAWLAAVSAALANLPTRLVIRAARDALHQVFAFPNEVEGAIRRGAESLIEREQLAIAQMERLKREITRAAQPKQPQIEHQPRPWTVDRLRETPLSLVRMGIKINAIPPELVAEVYPDGVPEGA